MYATQPILSAVRVLAGIAAIVATALLFGAPITLAEHYVRTAFEHQVDFSHQPASGAPQSG